MPEWVFGGVLVVAAGPGPVLLFVACRMAKLSRRAVDAVATALWGGATGVMLSIAIRSEPEYRLTSVGVVLTIAFLSALTLGGAMLMSKLRGTGDL